MCVPTERDRVKLAPIPRGPSTVEDHTRPELTLPSSLSLADPENVIDVPSEKLASFAGAVIVTEGAVLTAAVTVTDTCPDADRPPVSVADAVIRCVPAGSVLVKLLPDPIWPLRLEVQTRRLLMFPSSGSMAVPEKFTPVPSGTFELSVGAAIEIDGALFAAAVTVAVT
jgi:hypothetical protein